MSAMKKKLTRKQRRVIQDRELKLKEEEQQFKDALSNRKEGKWLIILGLIIFLLFVIRWLDRNENIVPSDLETISGTIESKLEVTDPYKASNYIEFHLKEYPRIDFRIENSGSISFIIRSVDIHRLNDHLNRNRQASLQILKSQIDRLDSEKSKIIRVHGLKIGNTEYLSYKTYNRCKKQRDKIDLPLFIILFLFLIGYGIREILKNPIP